MDGRVTPEEYARMGMESRKAKAAKLAFGDTDLQREVVAQRIGLYTLAANPF